MPPQNVIYALDQAKLREGQLNLSEVLHVFFCPNVCWTCTLLSLKINCSFWSFFDQIWYIFSCQFSVIKYSAVLLSKKEKNTVLFFYATPYTWLSRNKVQTIFFVEHLWSRCCFMETYWASATFVETNKRFFFFCGLDAAFKK